MPIKRCFKNGVAGWKFGDDGRCYTGPGAKAKARRQGRAIQAKKHMGAPMAGDAIYNICCENFQVILGDQLTEIDGTVFLGQCQNPDCAGICDPDNPGSILVDIDDFDWEDWTLETIDDDLTWGAK